MLWFANLRCCCSQVLDEQFKADPALKSFHLGQYDNDIFFPTIMSQRHFQVLAIPLPPPTSACLCVRACLPACVCACARVCVCACLLACVCVCVMPPLLAHCNGCLLSALTSRLAASGSLRGHSQAAFTAHQRQDEKSHGCCHCSLRECRPHPHHCKCSW